MCVWTRVAFASYILSTGATFGYSRAEERFHFFLHSFFARAHSLFIYLIYYSLPASHILVYTLSSAIEKVLHLFYYTLLLLLREEQEGVLATYGREEKIKCQRIFEILQNRKKILVHIDGPLVILSHEQNVFFGSCYIYTLIIYIVCAVGFSSRKTRKNIHPAQCDKIIIALYDVFAREWNRWAAIDARMENDERKTVRCFALIAYIYHTQHIGCF